MRLVSAIVDVRCAGGLSSRNGVRAASAVFDLDAEGEHLRRLGPLVVGQAPNPEKRAMIVRLGEPPIHERHGPNARDRVLDGRSASANRFQERAEIGWIMIRVVFRAERRLQ